MAELGPGALAYHGEVGRAAARAGVDVLVAVGPLARGYLEGAEGVAVRLWAPNPSEGLPVVHEALQPGDCVLVKGSRSMGLEAVAEALSSAPAVER
jgi:UDP-N-acetylmuramoyl-tripeptide--D-alanyl-D-alanine ligase